MMPPRGDAMSWIGSREPVELLCLQACLERADDDPAVIAKALGLVVRAKGITALAKEAGIDEEMLRLALSGEFEFPFTMIAKVCRALNAPLTLALDTQGMHTP